MKINGVNENKLFIVLQGGSGSGKNTLAKHLERLGIPRVVTCTTRDPKTWEENGVDYYFKTVEEFHKMELLESTSYADNYYGTSREEVEKLLGDYDIICLVLEQEGANNLKLSYPENTVVISLPIDCETIEKNLTKRGDDTKEIDTRVSNALKLHEDEAVEFADFVIVGNDIKEKFKILDAALVTLGVRICTKCNRLRRNVYSYECLPDLDLTYADTIPYLCPDCAKELFK